MTLVRWSPWREIDTLHNRLDRLFDDSLIPREWQDLNAFATSPPVELSETDDAVQLKLEVPGMDAKDLNVEVTEKTVSISGERKSETTSEAEGVKRSEFRYGKFQRVIPLPARVQNTSVDADYKDGILNLTLPKSVEEKNKVVKINLDQAAA